MLLLGVGFTWVVFPIFSSAPLAGRCPGEGFGQRCWAAVLKQLCSGKLEVLNAVCRVLPSAPSIQLAAAEQMEQISAQLSFLRPLPQFRVCGQQSA